MSLPITIHVANASEHSHVYPDMPTPVRWGADYLFVLVDTPVGQTEIWTTNEMVQCTTLRYGKVSVREEVTTIDEDWHLGSLAMACQESYAVEVMGLTEDGALVD